VKPESRRKIRTIGRKVRTTGRFVKLTTYIVVIVRQDGGPSTARSGGWTSFMGQDREEVIAEAVSKMREWERAGSGPYALQVGTIEGRVEFPVLYNVVPLLDKGANRTSTDTLNTGEREVL